MKQRRNKSRFLPFFEYIPYNVLAILSGVSSVFYNFSLDNKAIKGSMHATDSLFERVKCNSAEEYEKELYDQITTCPRPLAWIGFPPQTRKKVTAEGFSWIGAWDEMQMKAARKMGKLSKMSIPMLLHNCIKERRGLYEFLTNTKKSKKKKKDIKKTKDEKKNDKKKKEDKRIRNILNIHQANYDHVCDAMVVSAATTNNLCDGANLV